jgi:hypothetical protein
MATGTSSRSPAPAFHVDDPEQTTGYRSLSVPAVIGLLLGLASPLCFGAPLLYVIPIAGVAISVFALLRIGASDGALAGWWAAAAGLALSTAMLVAPVAREYVLSRERTAQATAFATNWLDMIISGQAERAFKLTNDSLRGPAPPADPALKAEKPADPFDTFRENAVVKALLGAGAYAQVRLVDVEGYDPQSFDRVFVRERYEVTPAAAKGAAAPIKVGLTLQHARLAREGRSRWMVYAYDDGSKPSTIPAPAPQ